MKDWGNIFMNLEGFARMELEDIRRFFGAKFPSHIRKNEFVSRLGAFIIDNPSEWLRRMLERDLLLLRKLVAMGPEVPVYLGYPDYPTILETVRLLGSDTSDGNFRALWIPKQLYDVVAPHIDAAIIDGEVSGRFEMERAALGYLSLYGVMTLDQFLDCMMEYWDYHKDQDVNKFVDSLYESPVMKLCRSDIQGCDYMSSPGIFEPEDVIHARAKYKDVSIPKQFTPQEAIEAGKGAPYFVFGLGTPQGRRLVEVLTGLGYSSEELVREEHDIWVNSQMIGKEDTTEAIFMSINRKQDLLPSFDEYDSCMDAVADYANSLPKWALNGFSSDEKNCLKVVLRSEDDPIDALVRKNPLLGLFIPPAPADDPCPCGSGFSYRNCHGKLKN